jgi:hypothetical protein
MMSAVGIQTLLASFPRRHHANGALVIDRLAPE